MRRVQASLLAAERRRGRWVVIAALAGVLAFAAASARSATDPDAQAEVERPSSPTTVTTAAEQPDDGPARGIETTVPAADAAVTPAGEVPVAATAPPTAPPTSVVGPEPPVPTATTAPPLPLDAPVEAPVGPTSPAGPGSGSGNGNGPGQDRGNDPGGNNGNGRGGAGNP